MFLFLCTKTTESEPVKLETGQTVNLSPVWPVKSRQKYIKVSQLEKWKILKPLQKLPKCVGNLDKLIAATGFEKLQREE